MTHTDRRSIANELNTQFCSVFTQSLHEARFPNFPFRPLSSLFESVDISPTEVALRLSKLDRNKSSGVDGVSSYVLNECSNAFSIPLGLLFNKSLKESSLPNAWREANVKPLFKKGSRLDPANYRPISLTSIVCKVMESFIRDSLLHHLIENKLISKQQHGFVPRKSCTSNLLETIDFVTLNMSKKKPVDIVFLDFSKAFDKVSHPALLLKLEAYGIQGPSLKWISAFPTNRRQRVLLGDSISQWSKVLSGVPQGSVLGPVLFLIFVNDLTDIIKNTCKLYADDCKLLASVQNAEEPERLQQDIHAVQRWCDEWMMQLNYEKCKVMHCCYRNQRSKYNFFNQKNSTYLPLEVTV